MRIFNGLGTNGEPGIFGGTEVDQAYKYTVGAITVANLNDTDGDDKIDMDDNEVIGTGRGVDELDLMKLIIEPTGTFSPDCSVNLELRGSIALWEDYRKITPFTDQVITVSDNSGNPMTTTLYIEAVSYSSSIRDMGVSLAINGEIQDEVRATAIWIEGATRIFNIRGNSDEITYVPDGLPYNPDPVLDLLFGFEQSSFASLINSHKASDNSRYGFGRFFKEIGDNDCSFGGRILFEYEVHPADFVEGGFNVSFDIGRRKQYSVLKGTRRVNELSVVTDSFPELLDMSNDDYTVGLGDNDEERYVDEESPNMYSYDTPSSPGIRCSKTSAFVDYHSDFQEYVRISIDDDVFDDDVDTDALLGSRCSEIDDWHLNYNIVQRHLEHLGSDPYDISNHQYELNSELKFYSQPTRWYGAGEGQIDIALSSTSQTRAYTLFFFNNKWILYDDYNFNYANDQLLELATSNTSPNGPWLLETPDLTIKIKQSLNVSGHWQNQTLLDFNVYNVQNQILNELD